MTDVLSEHESLAELLDNDWLSLSVVDPMQDDRAFHYDGDLEWMPLGSAEAPEPAAEPAAAGD